MFDGTLGTWKTDPVEFELKEDAKPICSRPYPVLKVHEKMSKKEVERLLRLGVLKVKMIYNVEPNPLHNLNLNQNEYVF